MHRSVLRLAIAAGVVGFGGCERSRGHAATVSPLSGSGSGSGPAPASAPPLDFTPDWAPPSADFDGPYIELLGVAQDAGVPQAACQSVNCEAARSDRRRVAYATSLALVTRAGDTFLFEATPDIRPQLDRVIALGEARGRADRGRRAIDGIFLTHAHMGHYAGLIHLGFEAAHSDGIPTYGSAKMAAFLHDNQPWRQLVDLGNIRSVVVEEREALALSDDVTVRAVTVPHRDELSDTVAWRIEGPRRTVLFMPDCEPWQRWAARGFLLDPMLDGVHTFVVDATFYSGDELPGRDLDTLGHPLVTETVQRLASRVDAGTLDVVLIHFNHSNPLLDPAAPQRVEMAKASVVVGERGLRLGL